MPINATHKQNFQDFLNRKVTGSVKCPICGHTGLDADHTAVPQLTTDVKGTDQLNHLAMLQCKNCTHIMLFSSDVFKG